MVKRKGLLAKVNTPVGSQYSMDNLQNIYKMKTELEFEIVCPRCYDSMTLCSDFDSLCYFCEHRLFTSYIKTPLIGGTVILIRPWWEEQVIQ